ncbi:MAG: parallel beta-helix domain-containing protein [Pseudomonadota bacterium]
MSLRSASLIFILAAAACSKAPEKPVELGEAAKDYQATLMEQLIDAKPGDVIEIPEGVHQFDRSLSLTSDGVTIRGAGMDKTILSFKNQIAGAEGLLVTASDFVIEDLAIEDAKGDALKINEGENIIIRRIRTEWTNGPDTENGAYGIYPVQTTNVLMEGNVAIGASDAGIYVGQSRNVIVRNNRAEFNVAGIEIENTINADVFENVAKNNTGGILVFNMPALKQAGYGTRVFNNDIADNNYRNFGHAGTPVASVPAGSGVVVNSNDGVEIFNNRITNNKTSNIIISSLFSTGYSEGEQADVFDPYPEGIFIYDNTYEGGGDAPGTNELKLLKVAKFGLNGNLPDVLWDGYVDSAKMVDGALPENLRICVQDEGVEVLNADGPNKYKNPRVEAGSTDCTLAKLPPVVIELS